MTLSRYAVVTLGVLACMSASDASASTRRVPRGLRVSGDVDHVDMRPTKLGFLTENGRTNLAAVKNSYGWQAPTDPALGDLQSVKEDDKWQEVNCRSIWVNGSHQVFYRISADSNPRYWNRAHVFVQDGPPGNIPTGTPAATLGGESAPKTTDWQALDAKVGEFTYWVTGASHRHGSWRWNDGLKVRKEIYTGGVLYTLSFDDVRGDLNYGDMTVQIAVVWR